jgi:tetratricopeptide (TPR) repeat protein
VATTYHQLGVITQHRGRWDEAEDWYHKSLTISEDLGDRPGMAATYHQLGRIAELRGRWDDAEDWYHKALTINEDLGNQPGMALSFGQLALLAEAKGRPREALEWMVRCITVFDEFPHPSTGPGPVHLVRLTTALGADWLRRCWLDVTGHEPPAAVISFIESHQARES